MATSGHSGFRGLHLAVACALVGVVSPRPAAADVFEIGSGGDVHIRATSQSVQQIGGDDQDDEFSLGPVDADDAAPYVPPDAITVVESPAVPNAYRAAVDQAAANAQISPDLLAALVWQESRWQPAATSPKGAMGLTQLMPATAASLSVDARDPAANLIGGATYLRRMLDMFDGDVERALAAYNAGPARVIKAGGVPSIAETRAYVSTILNRLGRAGPVASGDIRP